MTELGTYRKVSFDTMAELEEHIKNGNSAFIGNPFDGNLDCIEYDEEEEHLVIANDGWEELDEYEHLSSVFAYIKVN